MLYLFGVCLVLRVSGIFEGNITENHTNEHVDAGLHLLKKKTLSDYEYEEGWLDITTKTYLNWAFMTKKVASKSLLTSTKDEVQKFAKDQMKGGVGDWGKYRRFYSQTLLLLRQDRLTEVGCQSKDSPGNDGHQFSCCILRQYLDNKYKTQKLTRSLFSFPLNFLQCITFTWKKKSLFCRWTRRCSPVISSLYVDVTTDLIMQV